jgi:DNA polymerase
MIGEAPGKNEDLNGKPFIGRAGEILGKCLNDMGLSRRNVFITNVVKCRPPNNRDPLPMEKEICKRWLIREIDLVKPKLIITLGRHAGNSILENYSGSGNVTFSVKWHCWVFTMIHPAAALYGKDNLKELESNVKTFNDMMAKMYVGKEIDWCVLGEIYEDEVDG